MRQIQEALATPVGASAYFDEVLILLFGKKAHLRKTGSTHNMSKHFSKYVEIILFNNIWKQDELEAELEDLEEEELEEEELPAPPARISAHVEPLAKQTSSSMQSSDLSELTKLQAEMALYL